MNDIACSTADARSRLVLGLAAGAAFVVGLVLALT
jgi:hypothetical protein